MHIRLLETMNGTSFTVLQTETTPYRFNSFLVAKYSATSSAVPNPKRKATVRGVVSERRFPNAKTGAGATRRMIFLRPLLLQVQRVDNADVSSREPLSESPRSGVRSPRSPGNRRGHAVRSS